MTSVLLDLDGTLSDNFVGISRSICYALERMGAPDPGEDALRSCVGPPLRESFRRLIPGVDAAGVEAALRHYRRRYDDVGWCENVVYEGVAGALADLVAQGAQLFVCTSKPEVFATRIVAHFGLDAYVARVFGVDLGGRFDDKRVLLAHALATAQLDPGEAVMVGDRHHDVHAAAANGARAIGVLWGYGSPDELVGAERLLAHPSELATVAR